MKIISALKHQNFYFLGLALVVAGLPLSKPVISIGIMVLLVNWLVEGIRERSLKTKLQRFWQNKAAVGLTAIFGIHALGLITTSEFNYGFHDLRIKLPLLVLPLVIGSTPPLNKERFYWLMSVFVSAVLISTFFSTYAFLGFKGTEGRDIRDISLFGSHIRFGLLICLSIFSLLFFLMREKQQPLQNKLVQLGVVLWLGLFILILESMTAIVILLFTSWMLMLLFTFRQKQWWIKLSLGAMLIGVPLLVAGYIYLEVKAFYTVEPVNFATLDKRTPGGEPYQHYPKRQHLENGNYVWIYVATGELEESWNGRSDLAYVGEDKKGQPLHATLIRYLASKGLRKDASGVKALSVRDIIAIENGMANVRFIDSWSVTNRVYQIIWEFDNYQKGSNPQGNSVTQRIEFAKAAFGILENNWLFGVGTGDLRKAYAEQYEAMDSQLSEKYRLRAHNQYLTMAVAFGIPGFLLFLFLLICIPFWAGRTKDFLFMTFYAIALLSMINEDTLETQVGVTLVAFFACLYLFGWEEKSAENSLRKAGDNDKDSPSRKNPLHAA